MRTHLYSTEAVQLSWLDAQGTSVESSSTWLLFARVWTHLDTSQSVPAARKCRNSVALRFRPHFCPAPGPRSWSALSSQRADHTSSRSSTGRRASSRCGVAWSSDTVFSSSDRYTGAKSENNKKQNETRSDLETVSNIRKTYVNGVVSCGKIKDQNRKGEMVTKRRAYNVGWS